MSEKVLIDTCGWIDFLRSTEGSMGDFVTQAIEHDHAVLCGVVIAELLQGVKGKEQRQKLDFLFSCVEIVPTVDSCWIDAGITLQQLRSRGITLPLTDALIASIASEYNIPVLTVDKHFKHLPVKLIDF